VLGRALAFSDPDIIKMASEQFVAVTSDDWYQRRRQDAEGEFFRKIAQAAGKTGGGQPSGGSTRQGIYCFTADGQLLAYRNAGQAPDVMRQVLRQALAKWNQLPEERRKPGAVKVEDDLQADKNYTRELPAGGIILNVWTRILDRDEKNEWTRGTCKFAGGDKAARDHMWLTEAEWRSLVPDVPPSPLGGEGNKKFPLPAAMAQRLARFHLIDNTRGEPPMWRAEDIRKSELSLRVAEVTPNLVRLRLEGNVLLASRADPTQADRGFDVCVQGELRYNRDKKAFEQIDILAVGDHWGGGTFTPGARPGRAPLGVCFELAKGDKPADRVPPQAARDNGYFKTGR
jgi:hypothetical protein